MSPLQREQMERMQLEERLHRAEKMEVIGTMAGGIAHDLNNVLGVLVGYSELLLENVSEDDELKNIRRQHSHLGTKRRRQ